MADRCDHNTHIDIECADCLAVENEGLRERIRALERGGLAVLFGLRPNGNKGESIVPNSRIRILADAIKDSTALRAGCGESDDD